MAVVEKTLLLLLFLLLNSLGSAEKISCGGNETECAKTENVPCHPEGELSSIEKNYLIWLHTSIRQNMTKSGNENLPQAFFMKKIAWNSRLAKMAQTWAEKCKTMKEPLQKIGNLGIGQLIIAVEEKEVKNVKDMVSKWTSGLTSLTPEIIAKYREPTPEEVNYEPITQMIWWNTSQIGCGKTSYELSNCSDGKPKCLMTELVCNYFPIGNKEGEPVYITKNDNNLICQYDSKNIQCKDISSKKQEPKASTRYPIHRRRNGTESRVMINLRPVNSGTLSEREKCGKLFTYLITILFLISFALKIQIR